jgi:RNA polymerase sigma-70 factor, ECF subfamily
MILRNKQTRKGVRESSENEVREIGSLLATDDASITRAQLSLDHETQLFHKFLAGGDDAYRTLYDAYERPLYIYCCRLLGNEDEAKDVFQEIWVRMYRMRGEQIQVRRFSGLLFTIARNYCLNAIRDSKVLSMTPLDEMSEDSESFFRSRDIESSDLRELLQKAMAQLPLQQREAFVLREYVGYSYDEVAEIMGTNAANVRARAHRARERLRKMIGAWLELKEKEHK